MTKIEHDQAIETESQLAVKQFLVRTKKRDWTPDSFDWNEVSKYGHLLTPDTITIAEGFLGIEAQLPFYLAAADEELSEIPSEVVFMDRWGFEEDRHEPTLASVLIHSGARTPEQIAKYKSEVLEHAWSPRDHQGLDTLLGVRIYRMFQERGTYVNYRGLYSLIRQDYGLPKTLTPEEREKGQQIGACEPVNAVSNDELGHHVINLKLVGIHLRHSPEETNEKIEEIQEGFRMPALHLLPNRREFVQALGRTRIYDRAKYEQLVVAPTRRYLGLAA